VLQDTRDSRATWSKEVEAAKQKEREKEREREREREESHRGEAKGPRETRDVI